MTDFDKSMAFVLKWEGGYVNNPQDPGGETKFGIAKKFHPTLDIKELTEEGARAIYAKHYWATAGCSQLEWPMCLVVFDTAVQHGVKRALEFKAHAFNWSDYLFLRLAFYNNISKPQLLCPQCHRPPSLKGWINRLVDLYRTAKGA